MTKPLDVSAHAVVGRSSRVPHFDVAVVGLGGVGSATLAELSSRGVSVVGIDRFEPPHTFGSSHGHTRVIRKAYFEHPDYVPLAVASYAGWRKLESTSGRRLLHQIGLLQAGPADGEVIRGVRQAASLHRLELRDISAAEVETQYPGLVIPAGLDAVVEPDGGYLLVEECVRAALDIAMHQGAVVQTNREVRHWSQSEAGFRLHFSAGDVVDCERLVIAAGPWANDLLGELGVRLRVLRKSLFWYSSSGPAANELPVFLLELPDGVFYGFPNLQDRGIKLAEHSGGTLVDDPLAVDHLSYDNDRERVEKFARHCVPSARERLGQATCLYTMTDDSNFVVDHWPNEPRIVFAAGLSGHGFKFAPVLAQALADLVLESDTTLPIDFLSLKRFDRQ